MCAPGKETPVALADGTVTYYCPHVRINGITCTVWRTDYAPNPTLPPPAKRPDPKPSRPPRARPQDKPTGTKAPPKARPQDKPTRQRPPREGVPTKKPTTSTQQGETPAQRRERIKAAKAAAKAKKDAKKAARKKPAEQPQEKPGTKRPGVQPTPCIVTDPAPPVSTPRPTRTPRTPGVTVGQGLDAVGTAVLAAGKLTAAALAAGLALAVVAWVATWFVLAVTIASLTAIAGGVAAVSVVALSHEARDWRFTPGYLPVWLANRRSAKAIEAAWAANQAALTEEARRNMIAHVNGARPPWAQGEAIALGPAEPALRAIEAVPVGQSLAVAREPVMVGAVPVPVAAPEPERAPVELDPIPGPIPQPVPGPLEPEGVPVVLPEGPDQGPLTEDEFVAHMQRLVERGCRRTELDTGMGMPVEAAHERRGRR